MLPLLVAVMLALPSKTFGSATNAAMLGRSMPASSSFIAGGVGLLLMGDKVIQAADWTGSAWSGKDRDAGSNASSSGCPAPFAVGAPAPSAAELHAVQLDLLYEQRRRSRSAPEAGDLLSNSWEWPPRATAQRAAARRELQPVFFSLLEHSGARTLSLR